MNKNTLLKSVSAILLIVVIVVNALANILPINNLTTGMVSNRYPNLFTPAGITFIIWTIIYLSLAIFVIKQFIGKDKKTDKLNKINLLFIASSVFNVAWIFAWHYLQPGLALVLIVAMLICLVMIAKEMAKLKLSDTKDAWIKLPFGIYFGWITIATIANTTALLVDSKWDGFGLAPVWWMVIISALGAIIGLINNYFYPNVYYLSALIWAYVGILIRHLSNDKGFAGHYQEAIITVSLILIILVANLIYVLKNLRAKK